MAASIIVSHVVPFPQIREAEISQQDLIDFVEAQNTLAKLKKHVDGLEASISNVISHTKPSISYSLEVR
jgi:hypothetical protein